MDYLALWLVPFTKALLALVLFFFILNIRRLASLFSCLNRRGALALTLIFLSGLVLRVWGMPHAHTVFYDEFEHINIAQNIDHAGRFSVCQEGGSESCARYQLLPWPPGHHILLSLFFRMFGHAESVAYHLNAVIGALTIPLVFLLFVLKTGSSRLSLVGALLFSLIPAHLRFSGSSALCVLSIFSIVGCLIYLELFLKNKTFLLFVSFLASLLFALYVRPENFLMVFVCGAVLGVFLERPGAILLRRPYVLAIAVFFLLTVPLAQLIYYGAHIFRAPGWSDPLWTRGLYLLKNSVVNVFYFFSFYFVSPLYIVLAVAGARRLFRADRKYFWVNLLFFAVFFVFYSSYHIGAMMSWDSSRYSLVLFIPLLLFAVEGFEPAWRWIAARKYRFFIRVFVLITFLGPVLLAAKHEDALDREYRFILSMKGRLPDEACVISSCPAVIIASINRKAINPGIFRDRFYDMARSGRTFILFKGDTWGQDVAFCASLTALIDSRYNLETIAEEGGLGFYRLAEKGPQKV